MSFDQLRNLVLFAAMLFFAALSVRYYFFSPERHYDPAFAVHTDKEHLLKVLRWYNVHAIQGVNPAHAGELLVRAEAVPPESPTGSAVEFFPGADEGPALFENCTGSADLGCRFPQVAASYRRDLWWPGAPHSPLSFRYRKYDYTVLEVTSVKQSLRHGNPVLLVEYRWKIEGPSALERRLRAALPEESSDAESAKDLPAGTVLGAEVTFYASKYGYFLPLTREALPPRTPPS